MYMVSGFLGSNIGTARSPPPMRPLGRESVVMVCHEAPASVLNQRSTLSAIATEANSRLESLKEIANWACTMPEGSPPESCCQLEPPSVDLKMPPPVPFHEPFSHGP